MLILKRYELLPKIYGALPVRDKYFDNGKNTSLWFDQWLTQDFSDRVSKYPTKLFDKLLNMEVIAADICVKTKRIARLTVLLENDNDTSEALVNDVSKVLAIMLRNKRNEENNSPSSELIHYLLDNEQVDINRINHCLELGNIKRYDTYSVAIVESNEQLNQKTLLTYWMSQFKATYPNDLILFGNNHQLVMVSNDCDKLVHFYNHYMVNTKAKMAISYPFLDLLQLNIYFKQAKYALLKTSKGLIYFNNVKMDYMYHLIGENVTLKSLVHPIVLMIRDYDHSYNTQYFVTLDTYVNKTMMKEKCAQLLQVHVNTIKYRMHQMELMFGIDFTNLSLLQDLAFSCDIIKGLEAENI